MSSFDALESSTEGSRPIEIYDLMLGPVPYYYTSQGANLTVGGNDYAAIPIERGSIAVGQTERKRVLEISVPISNAFVQNYVGVPPSVKSTVTITRLQRDESPPFDTKIKIFEGAILTVRFPSNGIASIAAQTFESVVSRIIPRRTYMGMCNHALYGKGCGVDPNSFKFSGTISAVDGNMITVTNAGGSPFDFTGGLIKLTGTDSIRMVLSQSGDDVTVMVPFSTNAIGSVVDMFAGCDHLIDGDCALVFDNVINHGGFPFIPTKNHYTQGVQ